FDRHLTPEPSVTGAIDFAHPTGPEQGKNLVRTELETNGKSHYHLFSILSTLPTQLHHKPERPPVIQGVGNLPEVWVRQFAPRLGELRRVQQVDRLGAEG